MTVLNTALGAYELDHYQRWSERGAEVEAGVCSVIDRRSRVMTIGSCFALEIAVALRRLGLVSNHHASNLFFTPPSLRQEVERVYGGWPECAAEPMWRTQDGWAHPFKDPNYVFHSEAELRKWSSAIDEINQGAFQRANVFVVTLGVAETWLNRATGNHFRQIPHPEVYARVDLEFRRLSVGDIRRDLERIRSAIYSNGDATLILTVSPAPISATFTDLDIRVANAEGKARLRAAVSEFVDDHKDVHYFPAYEIATASETPSEFFESDRRHVRREAVDYVVWRFLESFGAPDVRRPRPDTSWLTYGPSPSEARSNGKHRTVLEAMRRVSDMRTGVRSQAPRTTLDLGSG